MVVTVSFFIHCHLSALLQSPLERKKRFVSIRKERKEEESDVGDSLDTSGYSPSYHLASQYLADSSLSEDLNQFDFTMATAQQVYDRPICLILGAC